jgi:hypothetical protein
MASRHEVPYWTGKSLDSSTIKKHMAHMTDFSTCPKTHPILLPMMYQAEFHLGDIPKNAKPSDFILSNDDSMASFHRLHSGFDERARWANRVVYTRQRLYHVNIRCAGEPRSDPHQNDAERGRGQYQDTVVGFACGHATLDACMQM